MSAMTYKILLIHLLVLGYSHWVRSQGENVDIGSTIDNVVPSSNVSSQGAVEEEEEEEDNSAMAILQHITSLEEFITLLHRNGNPVNRDEIVSNHTDESGAVYINTGGRMAQPDDCSPRDTTVRLPFDNRNPNVVYFPRCTKIERCGGCCASPHLECVPSYTERVSYKVIKAEQPYPRSNHLEWKGEYAVVILDRHVTCRVQCSLTPDKCGPKKDFQERQCSCKCRVYERCQPPRVWDPEECECRCAEVLHCCEPGDACGLTFSKDTCECVVDPPIEVDQAMMIISNSNLTQEQIDAYFSSLNSTAIASSATSPSTLTTTASTTTTSSTTTTTTTTTTPNSMAAVRVANTSATATNATATTTNTTAATTNAILMLQVSDPCLQTMCPGNFAKVATSATTCVCRRIIGPPRRHRTSGPRLT